MKTKPEILDTLKRLAIEVAEIDPAKLAIEASLRGDLGLDSLDMIDLVTAVEDELGVHLTDKEMSRIETVTHLVDALHGAQTATIAPA